ncbi:MAG: DUF554 domain-containing protein [Planctomycetota bacterium]|jgi:uncharacterized membrane protein YqgA involved in biofilm formation
MGLWTILNGTIVNTATVIVGSLLGIALSGRLPDRYRDLVLATLGLITITLGIDASVLQFAKTAERMAPTIEGGETYGARMAMIMIGSLIIGGLLGTALRIHQRIEAVGAWIHGRFSEQDGHGFAEGFLTASVIFCVGPLTLLGCLQNGAQGDPTYLYIKAALDGFCSMALASAFGWGVLASIVTIVVFQGGLSLLASTVVVHPFSTDMMTIVGGIILLATAMMLLEIKKIPVADMLPAIVLPPLMIGLVDRLWPGVILPVATGAL